MISVNNINVNTNADTLTIDVSAATGYLITGCRFWTDENFKDYTKLVNLDYKLTNLSENESFTVSPTEAGVSSFSGIYFIEFDTDEPMEDECATEPVPFLVVVTNLNKYYKCVAELILTSTVCGPVNLFDREVCDDNKINKAMSAEIFIQAILKCLELGQFVEAISLLQKLKQICKKCSSCDKITRNSSCSTCHSYNYY